MWALRLLIIVLLLKQSNGIGILEQNLHQPSNLNKQIMPKELLSATHSHEALIMMQFPDTLKLLILQ